MTNISFYYFNNPITFFPMDTAIRDNKFNLETCRTVLLKNNNLFFNTPACTM